MFCNMPWWIEATELGFRPTLDFVWDRTWPILAWWKLKCFQYLVSCVMSTWVDFERKSLWMEVQLYPFTFADASNFGANRKYGANQKAIWAEIAFLITAILYVIENFSLAFTKNCYWLCLLGLKIMKNVFKGLLRPENLKMLPTLTIHPQSCSRRGSTELRIAYLLPDAAAQVRITAPEFFQIKFLMLLP